jgi:CheY-like chemotaxis protein
MSGGAPGRVHPIRDGMLIGRDPEAEITIEGSDVSRHHAKIQLDEDGGIQMLDLGSRNGTLVNGVRVDRQRLGVGDRVRLGSVLFVLSIEDQGAQAPRRPEAAGAVAARVVRDLDNTFTALAHDLFFMDSLPGTTNLTDHGLRTCIQEMQDLVRRASGLSDQLLDIGRTSAVVVPVAHLLEEAGRVVRRSRTLNVRVDLPAGEPLAVRGQRGAMLEVLADLCLDVGGELAEGAPLTVRATAVTIGETEADAAGVASPGDYVEVAVLSTISGDPPRIFFPRAQHGDGMEAGTSTQKIFSSGMAEEILVVDGDPLVRAAIRRALKRLGVTVREAAQGSAAMAQVQHHPEVSVVLVDLDVADQTAADLVARLRTVERPLVIVVMAGRQDASRVAATAADDYLPKPFDPDALWAFLTAALRG